MTTESVTSKRSSRLGIISFICAVSSLLILCGYGTWGAMRLKNSGPAAVDRMAGIGAVSNVASILLLLAAVGLGIVSLVRKESRGGWGFVGLALGAISLLGYASLMLMWLAM
jgi:hypothetical protein